MSNPKIPKALFDEVSEGKLEINLSGSRVVVKTSVGNSTITRTNDIIYFEENYEDVKTIREGCYEKCS